MKFITTLLTASLLLSANGAYAQNGEAAASGTETATSNNWKGYAIGTTLAAAALGITLGIILHNPDHTYSH